MDINMQYNFRKKQPNATFNLQVIDKSQSFGDTLMTKFKLFMFSVFSDLFRILFTAKPRFGKIRILGITFDSYNLQVIQRLHMQSKLTEN